MKLKKINNVKITPLKVPKVDICDIKGRHYFEQLTPNALLLARKNSGKTTVLYHIIKNCANRNTKVYIFCSTIYGDPSYKVIIDFMKRKGIEHFLFTEIEEGKVNHVNDIVDKFRKKLEEEGKGEKKKPEKKPKFITFGGEDDDDEKEKEYKPRKIAPNYIFLFDDISNQLRNSDIAFLLKMHRHFSIMNLISTQSTFDITPSAWDQIDTVLLWKHISDDKLDIIRKKLAMPTPLNEFEAIYHDAVAGDHNFLYIDKNRVQYRKNFCEKYEL